MTTLTRGERMFRAVGDVGEAVVAHTLREIKDEPEELVSILVSLWSRGVETGVRFADMHVDLVRELLSVPDDAYNDEIRATRDACVETIAAAADEDAS